MTNIASDDMSGGVEVRCDVRRMAVLGVHFALLLGGALLYATTSRTAPPPAEPTVEYDLSGVGHCEGSTLAVRHASLWTQYPAKVRSVPAFNQSQRVYQVDVFDAFIGRNSIAWSSGNGTGNGTDGVGFQTFLLRNVTHGKHGPVLHFDAELTTGECHFTLDAVEKVSGWADGWCSSYMFTSSSDRSKFYRCAINNQLAEDISRVECFYYDEYNSGNSAVCSCTGGSPSNPNYWLADGDAVSCFEPYIPSYPQDRLPCCNPSTMQTSDSIAYCGCAVPARDGTISSCTIPTEEKHDTCGWSSSPFNPKSSNYIPQTWKKCYYA